jgi:predicted dehydrogenase
VTVRAAVVGTGFGCLTHVRAMRAADFEVTALIGRDPEKTAARAQRFDIPYACTSLADAFAAASVDAVVIATPPHTHADLVLDAVAAGRHVLCEKPFARDATEAQSMLDAAARAGVVHLVGTEFRYAPGRVLVARSIRDGAIGDPRLATFLLHIPLLADPSAEVPEWWADAATGGGWLGAQASHDIDQVRTALGEFATVSASLPQVVDHGWTVEDAFVVHFRLRNGCVGVMQSVATDRGPMLFATRVAGTRGTVWAEGDRVRIADASGVRDLEIPPDVAVMKPDPPPGELMHTAYDLLHSTGIDFGPSVRMYETFARLIAGDALAAGEPSPATFADGVASMRVLDAIRESARENRTVEVPSA